MQGIERPLLVTDSGLGSAPMTLAAVQAMRDAGLAAELFCDLKPNPIEANLNAGLAAWRASHLVSLPTMLLILAGTNLFCALGSHFLWGKATRDAPSGVEGPDLPLLSSVHILRASPYLRKLSIVVTLGAVTAGVHRPQPRTHLPRGPGGEGHGQHLAGRDVAVGDQVRDAVGDGAGLARPRAGQDAHRAPGGQHGGALLLVKTRQERLFACHGEHHGRAG